MRGRAGVFVAQSRAWVLWHLEWRRGGWWEPGEWDVREVLREPCPQSGPALTLQIRTEERSALPSAQNEDASSTPCSLSGWF